MLGLNNTLLVISSAKPNFDCIILFHSSGGATCLKLMLNFPRPATSVGLEFKPVRGLFYS